MEYSDYVVMLAKTIEQKLRDKKLNRPHLTNRQADDLRPKKTRVPRFRRHFDPDKAL
jgi:hypothetical protein